MKKRIAIFISGRGSNMEAIIKNIKSGILKDCCKVVLVFSNKKTAEGLIIAKKFGVKTVCIESKGKKRIEFDKEIISLLKPLNIDYIVLAGYMRILSPLLIREYKNRIINIHPADTSLYKGLNAYKWAYDNKMPSTKITIHLVDEGVDTGKILAQKEVNLKNIKSLAEVEQLGLKIEHIFYSEVLKLIFTPKMKP